MDRLAKYRSVQYVENGSGFDGCDCFGFSRLYYSQELGIEIPHYTDFDKISSISRKIEISEVQKDDVLLFKHENRLHLGIAVNKRQFIHCLRSQGVVVSNIQTWRVRCIGVYRYIGEGEQK